MRFIPCALLLLLACAASSPAADIAGNWHVNLVGGVAHITIADADFEFHVEGTKLTGRANIGMGWPGAAPISKGTIDGDHISFLVLGTAASSSGFPKMKFTGTVHDDKIQLTMVFFYADDESDAVKSDFEGNRVTR